MLISPQAPATPSVAQQLNVNILIFDHFYVYSNNITVYYITSFDKWTYQVQLVNLGTLWKVFNVIETLTDFL